jgi:hypothetical protein
MRQEIKIIHNTLCLIPDEHLHEKRKKTKSESFLNVAFYLLLQKQGIAILRSV